MDQNMQYSLGLDLDGVLADFESFIIHTNNVFQISDSFPKSPHEIDCWDIHRDFNKVFDKVKHQPWFWAQMPVKECVLPFPDLRVDCYITARPISSSVSQKWVYEMGFPNAPVYTVEHARDKVQVAIDRGLTHFVDDKPSTVRELCYAGIDALLYKTPANRHEREGFNCISSLRELYDILGVCKGC